ncbi:MAG: hypothetical protein L3J19_05795 [Sulfurimonas sp.]|nr:hypothetical protein [Sulfurimonas sp.]
MAGLILFTLIAAYIILSIIVISKVYKKTKKIKNIFIALLIMTLIPTGDVIVGYPIYKYLSSKKAGVHVYETVNDVKGFYVGQKSNASEPHQPYKWYKFIDYKEKESGKYYRSYWLTNNTSKLCISPVDKASRYNKAFAEGRCIAKEEISENELSRWKVVEEHINHKVIPLVHIRKVTTMQIIDRETNTVMGQTDDYIYGQGWLLGVISWVGTGSRNWTSYLGHDFYHKRELLQRTLTPIEEK